MRKKIFLKSVAIFFSLNILFQVLYPTMAFALTGGPAQPESSAFTPIGTSDMVSLFSGDFNYNIPLMDVGGYPINISYQSGISSDQEASWVGLGWNINPGAINRNMRGLPDDFNGDKVIKEFNVKPNQTFGVGVGLGFEVAGFEALKLHFGVGAKYNNYTGVGFDISANAAISAGENAKTGGTASLGLHSSADGLDISPSLSFSVTNDRKDKADTQFGASIGSSFNSRSGLKALSINTSIVQGHRLSKEQAGDKTEDIGKLSGTGSSMGTGCEISMANNTYVPSMSMPMKNLSVNASFKGGFTAWSIDFSGDISGYYSEQRLAEKRQEVPAFGFLYSQNGQPLDKVLLDFNREKDGSFTKNTPTLPLTNYSYDVFSVSGQGVGGAFRPFRSDLGYVFDSRSTTTSDGYSIGVELGSGNLLKGGGNITINDINSTAGKWTDGNQAAQILRFTKSSTGSLREPCYFKEQGEKNVDADVALYSAIGEDRPVRIGLGGSGVNTHATAQLVDDNNNPTPSISATHFRSNRQKRNQLFSYISVKEYLSSAADKDLDAVIFKKDNTPNNPTNSHIGEITTTKTDGSRYVYGIPAYNTYQKEVTFSMGAIAGDPATGLISYNPGSDNSKGNTRGLDHYFSSTELPAYAHSYLLTEVLSADYVDLLDDGPTTDDYGTYTKFSYTKATGNDVYRWRVPYEQNNANYNEGLKTGILDNQGNYIYGEKEIWVLNKIETKNYIAIFTPKIGNRADGFDVAGENGGTGSHTTPLLKTISLYSRPDYFLPNGNVNPDAIPIKEVHFVYDYSLCPGTLNNVATGGPIGWTQDPQCEAATNAGGKLTLKQLYFTYGKSFKAKFNPYTFTYSSFNPAYGMKDYDRWGNYKPNNGSVLNAEYPYVEQNKVQADQNSSAWTLTQVGLPSGGTIHVDYESDDYAYVQDRQAMQMFKITGLGENPNTDNPVLGNLFKAGLAGANYNYMYFQIDPNVPWSTSDYLKGTTDMYFRFLINVNNYGKEYVSGYAEVDDSGPVPNHSGYAYIKLKSVDMGDKKASVNLNPISKAALQFARINTPRQAYGVSDGFDDANTDPSKVSMESVIKALADAGLIKNLVQTLEGANQTLYNKGFGKEIEQGKCWVRLLNPNQKKLGGGSRVKTISISDNWSTMTAAGTDFDYGQDYDYTKVENGRTISSGVASYEPMTGGDENPFRLPVTFNEEMKLAADFEYFKEEPFGETFFPGPSVGYSRVTVKNLQHNNVKRHATGKVVNEFYTSRDFPTITNRTGVDAKRTSKAGQALAKLLKLKVKDYMTASQGFSVEVNDMHGKPKATWVYAEDQVTPISGVEYKYKSNGNKLVNTAVVLNKNGSVNYSAQIGVDYDFVADLREQSTNVLNVGAALQIYGFATPLPIILPPILPIYTSEETRFRSASVTKVINRFGLLEETIAYDLGSKVSTKNLAYDSETGDVILTKTKNDFNDEVFSLSYAAHLGYDRMGPGYKNVGAVVSPALSNGEITNTTARSILVPGDEILVGTSPNRYWVSQEGSKLYLIDDMGKHVTFTASTIKVIRSGRKNMQGMPIGTVTALGDLLAGQNNLPAFNKNYKILSAGASEFSETWQNFCECGINPADPDGQKNPYLLGLLGNWRPKKSYTFLSDREQTKLNDNSNIRKDGTYSFFKPFWTPANGSDWNAASANLSLLNPDWTWTSEISVYSPFGPELENKDALDRYSAAVYGYNNALPIAVGSNARYREIGFDGFEDYDFDDCIYDHFSFEPASDAVAWSAIQAHSGSGGGSHYGKMARTGDVAISKTVSHSGKRSIKVATQSSISLTKTLSDCPTPPPGNE